MLSLQFGESLNGRKKEMTEYTITQVIDRLKSTIISLEEPFISQRLYVNDIHTARQCIAAAYNMLTDIYKSVVEKEEVND